VTDPEVTFEQAELELRRIVERLESGQVGVDEALALWERGEDLYALCRARLDAAEGKVEELAQRVQASRPSA
jgi:exodeoxyribonuclease VII small subunit